MFLLCNILSSSLSCPCWLPLVGDGGHTGLSPTVCKFWQRWLVRDDSACLKLHQIIFKQVIRYHPLNSHFMTEETQVPENRSTCFSRETWVSHGSEHQDYSLLGYDMVHRYQCFGRKLVCVSTPEDHNFNVWVSVI